MGTGQENRAWPLAPSNLAGTGGIRQTTGGFSFQHDSSDGLPFEYLDLSDFPALGSAVSNSSASSNPHTYAMTTASHHQELSLDDFPALPGASKASHSLKGQAESENVAAATLKNTSVPLERKEQVPNQQPAMPVRAAYSSAAATQSKPAEEQKTYANKVGGGRPAPTLSTSSLTFLPPRDPFGLLGLLGVIGVTDPDLNTFAIGSDLSSLGLQLNSNDPLFVSFSSPFSEEHYSIKPSGEPDYQLPTCYSAQQPPPISTKFANFSDETLFYIFYAMPRDILQEAAAQELYNRNWRYHKDMRLWLTKDPNNDIVTKNATFERGTYVFFDIVHWERVRKECVIWYEQIEERVPSAPVSTLTAMANVPPRAAGLPAMMHPQGQQTTGGYGAIGPLTGMGDINQASLTATNASISNYFQGHPRSQQVSVPPPSHDQSYSHLVTSQPMSGPGRLPNVTGFSSSANPTLSLPNNNPNLSNR